LDLWGWGVVSDASPGSVRLPADYPRRHGFRAGDLRRTLGRFAGLRVLVIGDLILDEYITCEPLGISQEDSTQVFTPLESRTFVGGAGIVAAHARGLGAEVQFLTVVGEDDRARYAAEALSEYGVAALCFGDASRPTTLKQRFRAGGKTLLRVTHLRQHRVAAELAERMAAAVAERMPATDLLLFADFNYGCLPQDLVDACIASARRHGVMVAADSQASSQLSDISRFKGMDLITPTEREARLAVGGAEGDLPALAARLQQAAGAGNLAITLGAAGMVLRRADTGQVETLPAFNRDPVDVAGAGDSFFCVTAMAMRVGEDLWRSAWLGSVAAACQVARLGNVPLGLDELHAVLDSADAVVSG
jgi:rfaE bifunctional protein kinase chain/domain